MYTDNDYTGFTKMATEDLMDIYRENLDSSAMDDSTFERIVNILFNRIKFNDVRTLNEAIDYKMQTEDGRGMLNE